MREREDYLTRRARAEWPDALVYREPDGTIWLQRLQAARTKLGSAFPLAKRALHRMINESREARSIEPTTPPGYATMRRLVDCPFPTMDLDALEGPVYKYMTRENADRLLSMGEVRVGTLLDYTDEEKHGSTIGDRAQGALVHCDARPMVASDDPTTQSLVFHAVVNLKDQATEEATGGSIIFQGINFEVKYQAANCLMYCVSRNGSPALHLEFQREARYDTCLVIDDPKSYFQQLDAALREQRGNLLRWGAGACEFAPERIHGGTSYPFHPALLKRPEIRHHAEVRGLWELPPSATADPIILRENGLRDLCRLHRHL